ncbi:MAG: DNA-directed RNA polymerase, subunit E'' [Nitrososphaerota archaeon]|jgi:DNA-directed RNA polymerase subunit E"|nr:DNA-directed RNA polymerase, subunit E'' [Nitrososphaerota archaeon]
MKELACRKCKALTTEKACPNDGSTELSKDWSGLIVIINAEKSQVAKTLGIAKPGRYALKVS